VLFIGAAMRTSNPKLRRISQLGAFWGSPFFWKKIVRWIRQCWNPYHNHFIETSPCQ
jgi:hypothetical protein